MDLVAYLSKRKDIRLLKFADDGTVKASAESTALCVEKINTILSTVKQWSTKNRTVINCLFVFSLFILGKVKTPKLNVITTTP